MHALALVAVLLLQTPAARPSGGAISGRVVYSDGTPATGMFVSAVLVGEPRRRLPARVDDSGNYRLTNIPPGQYYVRAGSDFIEGPFTYFPDAATEATAMPVTVAADTNIAVTFNLSPAASGVRVAGRVVFPPNRQSARTTLLMNSASGIARREIVIADDGTFEVPHVAAGRYTFMVNPAPGMQPQPIVVPDRDLLGVEVSVPRLFSVSGTVTTESGSPRPRFVLAFEGVRYRTTAEAAAGQGTFAAQLPEGEYRLVINGLPAGYYLKSISVGETDLIAKQLKISADANPATPIKVSLGASAGVTVTGRVVVSGGNASAAAFKGLALGGRAVAEGFTSPLKADGAFELTRVNPGEYFALTTLASGLTAPLVAVAIPNRNVRDLQIEIPPEVSVTGRIAVDGNGASPKFSLLLVRGSDLDLGDAKPGTIPSVELNALAALARNAGQASQIVQMAINAQPDGSFKMKLPEGIYRVAMAPGPNTIPPAYFIRSLTYAGADLLKEPMEISSEKSSELQIGIGTVAPNPWVKVSGRVLGADPIKGPFRVALEARTTSAIETIVNPDGSFEFPTVHQNNTYSASILPANDAASAPTVTVADKDVTGIQINVPLEKDVRILSDMEGGGTVPGFMMSFVGTGTSVNVLVKPDRGAFQAKLPMDERQVKVSGLPIGYVVKSVRYGSTDVLRQPLKITKDDVQELQVTLDADPAVPARSVRGAVKGLPSNQNDVRLVLNGASAFSNFETNVGADGSFSFSKIPQGSYVPTLIGAGVAGLLSPAAIVVSGSDLSDIEITIPKQDGTSSGSSTDEGPVGVVVSSFGGGSREAANESAAIAQLRTINTAEVTFLSSNGGKYGTIPQLIEAGLLDQRFASPISGFSYSIIALGPNYAAAAIPTSQGTGRFAYYSTPDAVIRYSTLEMLAPLNQGGKPVQ
jgi:hypothetical protein